VKLLRQNFGDLKGELKSYLSNSYMVVLVTEWVFRFCKFGRVPTRESRVDLS